MKVGQVKYWNSINFLIFVGQYSVFTAFLDQGDEVIMFEPYFDQYLPSVVFNNGKCVYVPLHPPASSKGASTSNDWTIDFDELRYVALTGLFHSTPTINIHFKTGRYPSYQNDHCQYTTQPCWQSVYKRGVGENRCYLPGTQPPCNGGRSGMLQLHYLALITDQYVV
jgi:hypothetical protein